MAKTFTLTEDQQNRFQDLTAQAESLAVAQDGFMEASQRVALKLLKSKKDLWNDVFQEHGIPDEDVYRLSEDGKSVIEVEDM